MSLIELILVAFGLSMDAFAVSVTNGIAIKNIRNKDAIKIALYMGGFQGLMPVIGWALGLGFKEYITSIDHWIALILLSIIGGKMAYEGWKTRNEPCEVATDKDPLSNKVLLLLAIATSIDALAVGVSFAFLNISILWAAVTIGLITFIVCVIGVKIGETCGCFLKNKAEIVGGVILILIGLKIFLEHTGILTMI